MADQDKLAEQLLKIAKEIRKESNLKFTGRLDIGLKMNQGGIDHVSVKLEKTLK